jgi:deazaflavin-dependent oxidoreductase (nitroreductase family)
VGLADWSGDDYCYLTTTGRRTGLPREIEIWFGLDGATLYMLAGSGERAQWVRNLMQQPAVTVRLHEHTFNGQARLVTRAEEAELARAMLLNKYQPRESDNLTHWSRTALPVAIDLEVAS